MPIRTVECMPMTADVAKPVLDRLALAQFIADGAHLPDGLNTRSDQEDLFRAMHGLTGWNDLDSCASDVTHIAGHAYVIALFLPFMAKHGYVLRKDPNLAGACDLNASLRHFEQLEREARETAREAIHSPRVTDAIEGIRHAWRERLVYDPEEGEYVHPKGRRQ